MVVPPTSPVLALNLGIINLRNHVPVGAGVPIENTTGVTIADVTTMTGASITITNPRDGANESLAVDVGVNTQVHTAYNSTSGTLILTGSASLAAYESVLESITYNDVAASPTTATRDIQFTVTDATGSKSNIAVATVSFPGTYIEASGPASVGYPFVVIDPYDVVSDPNSTTLVSATVAISSGLAPAVPAGFSAEYLNRHAGGSAGPRYTSSRQTSASASHSHPARG